MVHEIREKNLFELLSTSAREIGYRTVGTIGIFIFLAIVGIVTFITAQNRQTIVQQAAQGDTWAFEETFDGLNPSSPSQDLLPRTFDYSVTHRNHPSHPEGPFGEDVDHWSEYPADHGMDCSAPPTQHPVKWTTHTSNNSSPDKSFFICNNHMMSSMGQVDGYSVTNFWPKQEFDFSQGTGVLEFDVNINPAGRFWKEILIAPKEEMKIAPAEDWLPIDETYPKNRIVFTLSDKSARDIKVGTGALAPNGWLTRSDGCCGFTEWAYDWIGGPNDPALTDRRIRRKNRIEITNNSISWGIQKADGTFHTIKADFPQGIPFKRGLVMFKTHSYTPDKADNFNLFTVHWDNIRFNGPKLPPYENFEIGEIVNLEANGNVPIGSTKTVSLDLPKVGPNPAIFAQIQQPNKGQVLLSINGNPNLSLTDKMDLIDNCNAGGWTSVRVPVDPTQLKVGTNTFKWTVGPRPSCVSSWTWDGFAVKDFEVQFDGIATNGSTPTVMPTVVTTSTPIPNTPTAVPPTPTITSTPIPNTPTPTRTPTRTPTPTNIPTSTPTPIPPTPTVAIPTPTPTATPTLTPTPSPTATPTPLPSQKADYNKSGKVDIQDLSFLLSCWNNQNLSGDLNNDGKINTIDLSILLSAFGK